MPKLIPIVLRGGEMLGYRFYCPACEELHPFYTVSSYGSPVWAFNGNMEVPDFSPSLRMIGGNNCHLYLRNGQISYCGDSQHRLAGQTVPMVDFDLERWCPVDSLHTVNGKPVATPAAAPAPAAPKKNQKHKPECGDVGKVGDVGDLGSNAANE